MTESDWDMSHIYVAVVDKQRRNLDDGWCHLEDMK
eukprot:CAMPEP_0198293408 /NCGR_PEP_ID=MMETSP1449-20131203/17062_1 /TAXON_ID=420275 /ORGANISM="Attheya septentrionalis, Strain CCMP2084" /LENGTH=34 /DNA_ID= /DNA_START= /DNA_END= /DNA_ORIENTATION=